MKERSSERIYKDFFFNLPNEKKNGSLRERETDRLIDRFSERKKKMRNIYLLQNDSGKERLKKDKLKEKDNLFKKQK